MENNNAMKSKVQFLLTLIFLVVFVSTSNAQKATYWVVETNINQKNFTLVKFYDANDVLLDEVKLNGVYLDISRQKHRRKLNELLYKYNWRELVSSRKYRQRKAL